MNEHIIPECYFDTVLVKTILNLKNVNHQKTCYKVESVVRAIDDFAVRIIDKDKKEIDYLREFVSEITNTNLILWKHTTKQHYFIQIVPGIETWILNAAKECDFSLEKVGVPNTLDGLKKFTKHKTASESRQLKDLCNELILLNGRTIATLSLWLNYLYKHNRNADINVMKQWD